MEKNTSLWASGYRKNLACKMHGRSRKCSVLLGHLFDSSISLSGFAFSSFLDNKTFSQGESESRVREIFADARANSTKNRPAIIFIDEVDSVTRTRTAHEDESTRRLKSELLLQLEGDFSGKSVEPFIIACSNCPWDLDPGIFSFWRFMSL